MYDDVIVTTHVSIKWDVNVHLERTVLGTEMCGASQIVQTPAMSSNFKKSSMIRTMPFHNAPLLVYASVAYCSGFVPCVWCFSGKPDVFLQAAIVSFLSQSSISDPPHADCTRPMIGVASPLAAAISLNSCAKYQHAAENSQTVELFGMCQPK